MDWKMIRSQELTGYELKISTGIKDDAWDHFVAKCHGGHHVQTAMWASIKSLLGWQSVRFIACKQGDIAGGAQMLVRRVPLLGLIGYVVKGPLFIGGDQPLEDLVVSGIHRYCREAHIQYLAIQPPNDRHNLAERMEQWGYKKSLISFTPAPFSTLVIDLNKDPDVILAAMRSTTRYNIRLANRRGVTVREATESDLDLFYQTLTATSDRKNIKEYPFRYWKQFFEVFGSRGFAKIFLAEYQGEVLSSLLLVSFGDTVIYKKGGWMGRHRELHANDLLQWEAIQWAKRQGYRYYDFEGISPDIAKSILQTGHVPDKNEGSVASFKFGFGGQVVFYPEAYDRFYNSALDWGYWNIFRRIRFRSEVNYVLNLLMRS